MLYANQIQKITEIPDTFSRGVFSVCSKGTAYFYFLKLLTYVVSCTCWCFLNIFRSQDITFPEGHKRLSISFFVLLPVSSQHF